MYALSLLNIYVCIISIKYLRMHFYFAFDTSNFLFCLPDEMRSIIQDTMDGINKPIELLLPCPSLIKKRYSLTTL